MTLNLAMTGMPLVMLLALIVFAVMGVIGWMKWYYIRKSAELREEEYVPNPVKERNKLEAFNVFNLEGTFFKLGLVLALVVTLMAFSWTQFEKVSFSGEIAWEDLDEIDVLPPRTMDPPPPTPVLPPPIIEEVPEEVMVEETPDFVSLDIDQKTEVIAPQPTKREEPATSTYVAEKEPEVPEIFKVVEEMPRFPGCEGEGTMAEKKACADQKMLEFIYKHIKYPSIARESSIQGTCVAQFVVDKNGRLQDLKIVRDIGGQCGTEVLRVVNLMNEKGLVWTPGKQRGRAVNVQFNLPVKFRLE